MEALADALAKRLQHHAGIESTDEHRKDHIWVAVQRRRCEATRLWLVARIGESVRWALYGTAIAAVVALTEGGRHMLRRWLGME